MTNINNQRGAALLFALGILSLILVSGLAFLGNALISQKIAFNYQEHSGARFLARSAAERAIAHLTMFNVIQADNHARYYASDASSVYSRLSTTAINAVGENVVKTESDAAAAVSQDQLESGTATDQKSGKTKSKLNVGMMKFGSDHFSWYSGSDSRARWIYVHKDGKESNGSDSTVTSPIVGRYAYQVLPAASTSRISLYAVSRGAFGNLHGNFVNAPADTKVKAAKLYRWGIDVDELLIDHPLFRDWGNAGGTEKPVADDSDLSQREYDTFFNIHSGKDGALYLTDSADGTARKNVELQKRWVKSIFTEGMGRVIREAYPGNSAIPYNGLRTWYPRFNLGDFKPYFSANEKDGIWYSRFRGSVNNDTADKEKTEIENLKNGKEIGGTGKSVLDYLAGNTALASLPYVDGYVKDRDYSSPVGLPFLRRLGNNTEKGAFGNIGDLRKQIAANLNDYCDADSVPTSNVSASTWGTLAGEGETNSSRLPAYTGNEKTPYINEIAFGFQLTEAKFDNGQFVSKVDAEVIAELIKIYDTVPEIKNFKLKGFFKHLSLDFKVSFKGEAAVEYTKSDGTPGSAAVSLDGVDGNGTATFDSTKLKDFEINFNENVQGSGPYWVKNWQSNADQQAGLSIDFADEITNRASVPEGATGVKITVKSITELQVQLVGVNFNIPNLALMYTDTAQSPVVEYGVDFVKFNQPEGSPANHQISVAQNLFAEPASSISDLADRTKANTCFVNVGVMQAIDPRQNLHAVFTSSPEKTGEWFVSKTMTITKNDDKNNYKWDTFSSRISAGECNDCSSPKAPKYADGEVMPVKEGNDFLRDLETAEDPAWRENTAGKHISTAVIRNAPMRSPWELGFIHRGIPFQTINLKKTGGFGDGEAQLGESDHGSIDCSRWDVEKGTTYRNGDAGILDQIKMTEYNKSYGKVDLSVLKKFDPAWSMGENVAALNQTLFMSLFKKLERYTTAKSFIDLSAITDRVKGVPSSAYIPEPDGSIWARFTGLADSMRRSQLLDPNALSDHLAVGDPDDAKNNDAAKEELIGRTFNLIEGMTFSMPNTFQIVVVAQSIRDLSGEIVRLKSDGKVVKSSDSVDKGGIAHVARPGVFDANIASNESFYYDEIRGESRILVTVEKVHYVEVNGAERIPRARLRVKQIEYLD